MLGTWQCLARVGPPLDGTAKYFAAAIWACYENALGIPAADGNDRLQAADSYFLLQLRKTTRTWLIPMQ